MVIILFCLKETWKSQCSFLLTNIKQENKLFDKINRIILRNFDIDIMCREDASRFQMRI